MKHRVLISPADSKLIDGLHKFGIETFSAVSVNSFRQNEREHADMQMLVIDNTAFMYDLLCKGMDSRMLSAFDSVVICKTPKSGKYPDNVGLNAAYVAGKLFCKISALDEKVRNHCELNGIELINVNQGYTKCSVLVVDDNSIITADSSIISEAKKHNINVLKIRQGFINLKDADYGFIGGASGKIGETIAFFGDICTHPDAQKIIKFICDRGVPFVCLSDGKLNDVGGLVQLT